MFLLFHKDAYFLKSFFLFSNIIYSYQLALLPVRRTTISKSINDPIGAYGNQDSDKMSNVAVCCGLLTESLRG